MTLGSIRFQIPQAIEPFKAQILKGLGLSSDSFLALPLTHPENLCVAQRLKPVISLRMRGTAGLLPLAFDCLACSNKRFNETWMVFGGIRFQVPEVVEIGLHI